VDNRLDTLLLSYEIANDIIIYHSYQVEISNKKRCVHHGHTYQNRVFYTTWSISIFVWNFFFYSSFSSNFIWM